MPEGICYPVLLHHAADDGHRGNVGRVVTAAMRQYFASTNAQPPKAYLPASVLADFEQH